MKLKKYFPKIYVIFIIFVIFLLLIINTVPVFNLKVDSISATLVLILLLVPILPKLKKIKWGDLEAEITSEEVKKLELETNKLKPLQKTKKNDYSDPYLNELSTTLLTLVEKDQTLALAKLRIILEENIENIFKLRIINTNKRKKISLSKKINLIFKNSKNKEEYISISTDVINICNRAIHGEKISQNVAFRTIIIGLKLVSYVYGYHSGLTKGLAILGSQYISDE